MKRSEKKKSKIKFFGRSSSKPKEEAETSSVTTELFNEPLKKTSSSSVSVTSQPLLGATSSSVRVQSEPIKETFTTVRKLIGPVEETSSASRFLGTSPVEEITTSLSQLLLEPAEEKNTSVIKLSGKPVEKTTTITRRLVSEPIEKTTSVSRFLSNPTGKETLSVKPLFSDPTKDITSSSLEVFSKTEEESVSQPISEPVQPTTSSFQQLVKPGTDGTLQADSQSISKPIKEKVIEASDKPVETSVITYKQARGEPIEKSVTTYRKVIIEPLEKTQTLVRQVSKESVEKASALVRQVSVEPAEKTISIATKFITEPIDKTATLLRQVSGEPGEKFTTGSGRHLIERPFILSTSSASYVVSKPVETIATSLSELISDAAEKTVTSVSRLSGELTEKDTTVRQLDRVPLGKTVSLTSQVVSEPAEKSTTTVTQLISKPSESITTSFGQLIPGPVARSTILTGQGTGKLIEKSTADTKQVIGQPVERTATLIRQISNEPTEETTTTAKQLISKPSVKVTTSVSQPRTAPVAKTATSIEQLIGGPIQKTLTLRQVVSEPVERTNTLVKQASNVPVETTAVEVSRVISEPIENISTSATQLTGESIKISPTLVRELSISSKPIEKTTTTVNQVSTDSLQKVSTPVGRPFSEPTDISSSSVRQVSSKPIEKNTSLFRQLVTESPETNITSVSQLFTEPVVNTIGSVSQLTDKFKDKRVFLSRELMSEPTKEARTSVTELHLEPAEGSTTPTLQVSSEQIGTIPQSVRPRTDTSKKKSGELKSLGIKEGISQGQQAGERTSLLGSSFEIHPGVSYGGIAASFVGHPEAHPSTEFLMSSEGELVLSEEELKRKLKYFFMNPIEKWRAKGKFPWKLVLQVVKIIFVTVQLCIFGSDGYIYELQKQNTGTSFNHMLLKDWTALRDVVSYPPSTGVYAVYTKPEFYSNIDHVVKTYANITNIALGTYCYDGPNCTMTYISFCRREFSKMVTFNQSVIFDSHQKTICHKIPDLFPEGDARWKHFSIRRYLDEQNDTVAFDKMIAATITFSLKTIFLKSLGSNKYPDCYRFDINVLYDNKEHDGQVLVSLDTKTEKLKCYHNGSVNPEDRWGYILRQVLNCFIIFICILSLLLCCRCLAKGRYLCLETNKYFKFSQNKGLTAHEKMEFLDMWYCAMIFNDALIIAASILKAAIEQRTVESDQYATCAILLGVGNLLVWAGVLRYLGFFSKYNILILTMKKAIPNVLRFILCCVLLYAGFCFCGWVVLGPYHIKFRNLSSTSECLFAMMNGDDLFATFAITNTNNDLIWWFSRVYLYTFISMFIYVVISLFISVIMDSYETVKDHYRNGNTMTRIQTVLADIPEDSCSSFYQQRRKQQRTCWQWFVTCFRK